MAMRIQNHRQRSGFTLVELMVSAAVSVIIMAILATVFQSGIDVMRDMRSVGSLQDQLRAATEMIRRDLQADHFLARDTKDEQGNLISGPRLSDQHLTRLTNEPKWTPPLGGFFRIESNETGSVPEGSDGEGFRFSRSPGNCKLHFTSILPGRNPQEMYSAGNSSLQSPAAEIAYFLESTVYGSTGVANLHRLIRRQRLVATTESDATALATGDANSVALNGTKAARLNEVGDIVPRLTYTPLGTGDDVLLSNVISFEVKAHWDGGTPMRTFPTNTDAPFDFLSAAGSPTFDTGFGTSATSAPLKVRINAVQIRLRIFDPQMRTTRQVTIVQDL